MSECLPSKRSYSPKPDITVIILTYNEEQHVERAINSAWPIAREILVVDSFSTDRTVELASLLGARVLQNPFVNQAQQCQWALDHGGIQSKWILRLDADEVLEWDLQREICERLPGLPEYVVGVNFNRKHIFMDRWIRHGGRFPLRLLRLWRRGQGRVEQRWMDEHVVVWGGNTTTFHGGFADINLNDLTFFTEKHNNYATREALDVLLKRFKLQQIAEAPYNGVLSRQAYMKRWIKEKFYSKLPFWMGPLCYFLYRYILQLGILDGKPGLIYHFLQAFWYRFLVEAKVSEFEKQIVRLGSKEAQIVRLRQLTGLTLEFKP